MSNFFDVSPIGRNDDKYLLFTKWKRLATLQFESALPVTGIRHENGAFWKRSSSWALNFRVDWKKLKTEIFDNDEVSPKCSSLFFQHCFSSNNISNNLTLILLSISRLRYENSFQCCFSVPLGLFFYLHFRRGGYVRIKMPRHNINHAVQSTYLLALS